MRIPHPRLEIVPLTEGGYVATSPDVPGLVVEAEFLRDLREIADDVALLMALYERDGRCGLVDRQP